MNEKWQVEQGLGPERAPVRPRAGRTPLLGSHPQLGLLRAFSAELPIPFETRIPTWSPTP